MFWVAETGDDEVEKSERGKKRMFFVFLLLVGKDQISIFVGDSHAICKDEMGHMFGWGEFDGGCKIKNKGEGGKNICVVNNTELEVIKVKDRQCQFSVACGTDCIILY